MDSYEINAKANVADMGVAGFGMPVGDTSVLSTCPTIDRGMRDKSVHSLVTAGTAPFGTTPGTDTWRPPDW